MQLTEITPASANNQYLAAESSPSSQEWLSFRMGGEEYGIDILKVQEIRGYEQPTRMVGTPDFIKGVLNLRGLIVPILDLRIKFGLPQVAYDDLTVTVILTLANRVVGVVVDAVSDVVDLPPEQIKPVPEFSGHVDSACITGIATVQQADRERMLILLNIEKLMTSTDMGLVSSSLQ